MSHRNHHQQSGEKSRSESKKAPESRRPKGAEQQREAATERMASEHPSYESLDETSSGGSLHKTEHRADPLRMSKHGMSASSAERLEEAGERSARGESRGIGEASGGALSDDPDVLSRGESAKASAEEDLTWAGFARPSDDERPVSRSERATGLSGSRPAARGESSGRDQEPTARGGFIEPDERTSGSSRRH